MDSGPDHKLPRWAASPAIMSKAASVEKMEDPAKKWCDATSKPKISCRVGSVSQ